MENIEKKVMLAKFLEVDIEDIEDLTDKVFEIQDADPDKTDSYMVLTEAEAIELFGSNLHRLTGEEFIELCGLTAASPEELANSLFVIMEKCGLGASPFLRAVAEKCSAWSRIIANRDYRLLFAGALEEYIVNKYYIYYNIS